MKITISLFILLLISISTYAQSSSKTRVEIKHKSRDLEKIQAELERKRKEKEKLRTEEQAISKTVKENETKIHTIEKSLIFTLKRNEEIQMGLAMKKNEYDDLQVKLNDSNQTSQKLATIYLTSARLVGGGEMMPVYSKHILSGQLKKRGELKKVEDETKDELSQLTATHQAYHSEILKNESNIRTLKSSIVAKETKLKKVKSRQEVLETELKELQQTSQELSGLIEILRTKMHKEANAVKNARQKKIAEGRSPIPPRSLPWPISGAVVKQFGRQKHPELGTPYFSAGITIQSATPGSVQAVSDGKVLYVGNFMSYGPMVLVEHPDDWYTVYGNMSRWDVEKGQMVKKGTPLGKSGIGHKGVHQTYFELRLYGKPTDPLPWLKYQ